MIIDGDPKKIAKEAEKINASVSEASEAAASVIAAINTFSTEIGSVVENLPDDLKGKTLAELSEQAEGDGIKDADGKDITFPKLSNLKSGAEKAVATPGWFQQSFQKGVDAAKAEAGDFMGKVGSFFKSLFGGGKKGVDKGAFSEEIVACTAEELKAVSEAAGALKDEMTGGIEQAASGATQVQAGAAAAEETGTAGDAGGEGGGEGGSAEEKGEEAAAAAETAAGQAGNKPLGGTIKDILTAFSEPYEGDERVKNSIDKLNMDIKDSITAGQEMIGDDAAEKFQAWFNGLDEDQRDLIAPVAIKGTAAALKKAVSDNFKMESRNVKNLPLLSEVLFGASDNIEKEVLEDSSTVYESYEESEYTIDELVYDRWQRMSGVEGENE